MPDSITNFFGAVDEVMYYPILIIVPALAGLFFSFRTKFVQLRLFGTACKLIVEKPASAQKVIFVGALIPMDLAWNMADITMGGMTLINIPCCVILSGVAVKALRDFESRKKKKLNPVFRAKSIGLDDSQLSFWK